MTIVARAEQTGQGRQEKQSRQHRAAVAAVTAVRTTAVKGGRCKRQGAVAGRGKWSQC